MKFLSHAREIPNDSSYLCALPGFCSSSTLYLYLMEFLSLQLINVAFKKIRAEASELTSVSGHPCLSCRSDLGLFYTISEEITNLSLDMMSFTREL